jgi:ribosomal protein S18 acetylase RimI-like enzyme
LQHSALTIHRATAPDAARIQAMVRQAYAKWVPVIGREPLPMTVDYQRAVIEHEIDLLHEAGRLVALIEIIMEADHLFIENLAVDPAHQGRGFGRRLLTHAERRAVGAGLGRVRLLTNQAFASNVAFYQSAGFQIDGTEPFRGGTTVFMSKAAPDGPSGAGNGRG